MSRANRKPGRHQGIPRYRRAGQLALVLPGTLRLCVVCDDRGCEFCPAVAPAPLAATAGGRRGRLGS